MRIKAQKVNTKITESGEDTLARFCYHFPQYTYAKANKLPYKRILKMLKVARKEKVYEWYNQLRIAIAHKSSKKSSISNLIKEYKQVLEN